MGITYNELVESNEFGALSSADQNTVLNHYGYDSLPEPESEGALSQGIYYAQSSGQAGWDLATSDFTGIADTIYNRATYRGENPASKSSTELREAFDEGEGFWDGVFNTVGEIYTDVRDEGWLAGLKDVNALREGVVKQLPNMALPMAGMGAGMLAGAGVGSQVPVVGTAVGSVAGSVAGASLGNAFMESAGHVEDLLNDNGINPLDKAAVSEFVENNHGEILKALGIKGSALGVVDRASMGVGRFVMKAPVKAATNRVLKDMGVDLASKEAVSEAILKPAFKQAIAADAGLKASMGTVGKMTRGAAVTGLESGGEVVGEYVGSGLGMDKWDIKEAGLEGLSSLGSSAGIAVGQQAYSQVKDTVKQTPEQVEATATKLENTTDADGFKSVKNVVQANELRRSAGMIGQMQEVDEQIEDVEMQERFEPVTAGRFDMAVTPQGVTVLPGDAAGVPDTLVTPEVEPMNRMELRDKARLERGDTYNIARIQQEGRQLGTDLEIKPLETTDEKAVQPDSVEPVGMGAETEVTEQKDQVTDAAPTPETSHVDSMTAAVQQGGIDISSAKKMFSHTTIAELGKKRPGLFRVNGGAQIDEVATDLGYDSADSMVEQWRGAKTKKQEVADVQAEEKAQYEIAEDAAQEDAATTAKLYGEFRADILKEPASISDEEINDAPFTDSQKKDLTRLKKAPKVKRVGDKPVDTAVPFDAKEPLSDKRAGIRERSFERQVENVLKGNKEDSAAVVALQRAHAEAMGMTLGEYLHQRGIEIQPDSTLADSSGKPLGQDNKGAVKITDQSKAVVHAFAQADGSTMVHELFHVSRRDLQGDDLKALEGWAGVKEGQWQVEHEEKTTRAFERYVTEGVAPTKQLEQVFAKLKDMMLSIYTSLSHPDIDIDISPEVRAVFDRMLTAKTGGVVSGGVSKTETLSQAKPVDKTIKSDVDSKKEVTTTKEATDDTSKADISVTERNPVEPLTGRDLTAKERELQESGFYSQYDEEQGANTAAGRRAILASDVPTGRGKLPADVAEKNFKRWFKGSLAVTEDGTPQTWFHGSPTFGVADDPKTWSFAQSRRGENVGHTFTGLGMTFTPNYEMARTSARGGQITGFNLQARNPYVLSESDIKKLSRYSKNDQLTAKAKAFAKRKMDLGGYDSIYNPATGFMYVPRSVQSKEIRNTGSYSEETGDVLMQAVTTPAARRSSALLGKLSSTFNISEEKKDIIATRLWDRLVPVKRIQGRAKRKLVEAENYLLHRRVVGRKSADEVTRLKDQAIDPLLKTMADADLSIKDVGDFLWADHASERNLQMKRVRAMGFIRNMTQFMTDKEAAEFDKLKFDAKHNAELTLAEVDTKRDKYIEIMDSMKNRVSEWQSDVSAKRQALDSRVWTESERAKETPERLEKRQENEEKRLETRMGIIEKWEDVKDRLSGLTNEQAQERIDALTSPEMVKAAEAWRTINEDALRKNLEAGEITQEEYNAITRPYKKHVPLYREDVDFENPKTPVGLQSLGAIGSPIKTAYGSVKAVENVIPHIVDRAQASIERKHRLDGTKILYNMAMNNPEMGISISKQPTTAAYDKDGNLMRQPRYELDANQWRMKVDGETHILEVDTADKEAMRFVESLLPKISDLGPVLNATRKVNQFLAKLNTTYNPEFVISNFIRDIQMAGVMMNDTEGAEGAQKKIIPTVTSAIKGIYKTETNKDGGEWGKWWKDMKENGGKISFLESYETIEDLANKLETDIAYIKGEKGLVKQKGKATLEWIEAMNTSVENGVRLSTYRYLVETAGQSRKLAAKNVANLTVDFNRSGTWGPAANSLYMFANAGIIGNARMIQAVGKSKKVQKLAAGVVGAGMMQGVLNSLLGGYDDDGEAFYDKLRRSNPSLFERNMIWMLPGTKGDYIRFPLAYGLNVMYKFGEETATAIRQPQGYSTMKGAMSLTSTFMNAFNPVASSTILQTLSPTVTDPIIQSYENKNWFGGDLMPAKNPYGMSKPDSERYWKSVNPASKHIARGLNRMTGGDRVEGGLIDISPATLENVWSTFTGATGRFITDVGSLPFKVLSGDAEVRDIPFARKLAGTTSEHVDNKIYKENIKRVEVTERRYDAAESTSKRLDVRRASTYNMISETNKVEKKLRKLRKDRTKAEDAGRDFSVKRINKEIREIQRRYNRKFNRIVM